MKKRWWIIGTIAGLFVLALIFGPGVLTASGAEPATCATCHSMQEFYDGHKQSEAHAEVACSQCHLPHGFGDGLTTKYEKGFVHLWKTVTNATPEKITLKDADRQMLLDNCIACHANTEHVKAPENRGCLNCHWTDPHGDREDRR